MTKATQMAQVSAKGGFHLLWGLVVSTVISAAGTIFVARLLGADNYGLYLSNRSPLINDIFQFRNILFKYNQISEESRDTDLRSEHKHPCSQTCIYYLRVSHQKNRGVKQ